MIKQRQTWKYHTKSNDSGLADCTVGKNYTITIDFFNELAFFDDVGELVCIPDREKEFLKHFEMVDVGEINAVFQQVSKQLYAVDFDSHNEFSIGSKISDKMLNFYLILHPENVKINKLTKLSE